MCLEHRAETQIGPRKNGMANDRRQLKNRMSFRNSKNATLIFLGGVRTTRDAPFGAKSLWSQASAALQVFSARFSAERLFAVRTPKSAIAGFQHRTPNGIQWRLGWSTRAVPLRTETGTSHLLSRRCCLVLSPGMRLNRTTHELSQNNSERISPLI